MVKHDPYAEAVAASVAPARLRQAVPTNLNPSPLHLSGYSLGDCATGGSTTATSGPICRMGNTHAGRTMVLFGDSHAQMWMPALLPFATRHNWTLIPFVKVGCTAQAFSVESGAEFATVPHVVKVGSKPGPAAPARSDRPLNRILRGGTDGDPNGIKAAENGFWTELQALKGSAKLVVLEDIPYPGRSPIDCLLAHDATLGSCTYSFNDRFNDTIDGDVALSAQLLGAKFIPVVQWFCAHSQCPMVIGNTIAYFDPTHVSTAYAQQLARPLDVALRAATQA